MENLDQQIKKNAAIAGSLLGAIILVLGIFLFYFLTSMTTSFWMMIISPVIISILIPVIIAILFCTDLRKKIGGYWNFRQATTGIFIMFFVSYLVSFTGNMVFSKVIQPDMVDKMKTAMISATTQMMEKQGIGQDQMDQAIAKTEKQFDEQKDQSIGKIAKSITVAVIMIFVFSLIFAAFFKRERPLYDLPVVEGDPTA